MAYSLPRNKEKDAMDSTHPSLAYNRNQKKTVTRSNIKEARYA
jgi:hypothetical protein